MYGYMGQILRVDLSAGQVWNEPIDAEYARAFLGGSGLAARMACDMVDGSTDPLGPENPLIWMTGPLVGTAMPSAGRCSVCALSPLTGIWGESNTGGFVGPELRFAGYDGIVVTGRAQRPVWLSVVAEQAALHDAAALWGLDAYQTQVRVREAMGEPRARVACIGPAGENQVKMAAVMNDHGRAAARTGMGAVMGAKNLKAIGIRGKGGGLNAEAQRRGGTPGDQRACPERGRMSGERTRSPVEGLHGKGQVPLARPQAFRSVVQEILADVKEDLTATALRLAGTAGSVDVSLMYGDMPIRYYQQGEWEGASNLSGVLMANGYQNRNTACYRCPIACGRQTRAPRYGLQRADGPEYETLGALGTLVMVDDLEAVIYAGHLCNLYGLDTISTGSTIALACEMFERGLLTASDTGGLEVHYGDVQAIQRTIAQIAHREGLGDLLAEGSAALAERFGVPELAVAVNRLEVPLHDPRAFVGMAVTYALSPRGACHMQGDMYSVDMGQGPAVELGILPGDRFENTQEKGRLAARQQAWRNLYNALILCQFQNPGVERVLAALNSVTGWDLEAGDLMALGKRMVTLKRLLNLRRGLTRADDRLPDLLLRSLPGGGTEGTVPDVDVLLSGAYAEYGWDPQTGRPRPETLAGLGL